MVEAETKLDKDIEFKWGRRRGRGGKKKDVLFYGSFTYDGVEYGLYDSVYLYKEDEPEPYIGKLIKIWENPDKTKKVKVLWFFRPCEILNFLGVEKASDNELFLASGEGVGLWNINPLEAIAGKCNVVCVLKDSRNRQPTDEELQMADYVFFRTFDVGLRKVMDKIEENIAGIDVKFLLNRVDFKEGGDTLKVDSGRKEFCENAVQNDATVVTSEPNLSKEGAAVNTNGHCIDTSANEATDMNYFLIETKSTAEKSASGVCVTLGDTTKTNQRKESVSGHKALANSKADNDNNEGKVGKVVVKQVESEAKVLSANYSVELEGRPSKKAKISSVLADRSKNSMQQPRVNSDANDSEALAPIVSAADDKIELKSGEDSSGTEKGLSKKQKPVDKTAMLSNGKLLASPRQSHNGDHKADGQELEVTPITDADRRKWFKGLPWDDRMRTAYEQGTLVLLQNLDHTYTSEEVEDVVWHAFKERCTAKMIQWTAFSSPHSGQAFVIFKKKDIAEMVVRKLDESCLLLPNGRPLVGRVGIPWFPEKKPTFLGHLVIDKLRYQMQREQKDAVSTSHCSQPNTIEYDMAMEWCLRQQKSDFAWKKLYESQGKELRKLKAKLKAR